MALVFPSYDTVFPRSAESALSSAIMTFVSLWLANNYLRNSLNENVPSDWKHTQKKEKKKCNPPGQPHAQSYAQNTPLITQRKPAVPIYWILCQSKPFQNLRCTSSSRVMSQCTKERQMTERKEQHHLKRQLWLCQFCKKGVALCPDFENISSYLDYSSSHINSLK